MKKFLILLGAACLLASCNPINPVNPDALTKEQQQNKLKTVAEDILNEADVPAVRKLIEKSMSLGVDYEKYEDGKVIQEIEDAIESMTIERGNIEESVYHLYALCGRYSFINGVQTKTNAGNLIEVNCENKLLAKVEFSADFVQVLVSKGTGSGGSGYKIYVKVPKSMSLSVTSDGEELVKVYVNLDTNVSDVTVEPDMYNVYAVAELKAEVAGYILSIEKVSYKNRSAEMKTSIHHNDKMLFQENIAVSKAEFSDGYPCGAGVCDLFVDVLGEMQVKAHTDDLTAIITAVAEMDGSNMNEASAKAYAAKINGMFDNGVYFGTDTKQSWIELYPFYRESYYSVSKGFWYLSPVFVLADGTRFEDPSDFFSENYFKSIIDRAEKLAEDIEDIFE